MARVQGPPQKSPEASNRTPERLVLANPEPPNQTSEERNHFGQDRPQSGWQGTLAYSWIGFRYIIVIGNSTLKITWSWLADADHSITQRICYYKKNTWIETWMTSWTGVERYTLLMLDSQLETLYTNPAMSHRYICTLAKSKLGPLYWRRRMPKIKFLFVSLIKSWAFSLDRSWKAAPQWQLFSLSSAVGLGYN